MNDDPAATPARCCPYCESTSLARVNRTFGERIAGTFTGTKKYMCLSCRREFIKRFPPVEKQDSEVEQ
jgi:hypothetical protein